MLKIKLICKNCTNEFLVIRSESKRIFCGSPCKDAFFSGANHYLYNSKIYPCVECGTDICRAPSSARGLIFCSKACSHKSPILSGKISESHKGKVLSEATKKKLSEASKGELSHMWKGGKPKCLDCKKEIGYGATYCDKCKCFHRTDEQKKGFAKMISEKLKGKLPENMNRPGKFMNIKRGIYTIGDISIFLRSEWEANYFAYLSFLVEKNQINSFEYEADVFMFENIKLGTRSYRPDFKVKNNDESIEYHEVKGWMTAKSKTQLKRMAKYHPNIKLKLIQKKEYTEILNKLGALLPKVISPC